MDEPVSESSPLLMRRSGGYSPQAGSPLTAEKKFPISSLPLKEQKNVNKNILNDLPPELPRHRAKLKNNKNNTNDGHRPLNSILHQKHETTPPDAIPQILLENK